MAHKRREGSSWKRKGGVLFTPDASDGEDEGMEALLARHQQRNVSDWSQGDQPILSRSARRDALRDERRKRRRDDASEKLLSADESFEIDTRGVDMRPAGPSRLPAHHIDMPSTRDIGGLLLPGHVLIETDGGDEGVGEQVDEVEDPAEDVDAEGELGEFVRLDADRSGVARYYQAEEEEQRKAHEDCPACGERGHDKKSCPHLLCLACGALDEHSTRDCPMGMSCFRCGERGHKAFECKKPRTHGPQGWKECARCGATSHVETNCPTQWRIYSYNSQEDHKEHRRRAFSENNPTTGRAGFDYRSESESESESGEDISPSSHPPQDWDPAERWCYNCAAKGNHWGDDCPLPRCNPTRGSGDPSAYSEFMASRGPYAHSLPLPPPPDSHAYRNGLRRDATYDRFDVGRGSLMHVYDPQREAMQSVDQLFDRFGPGASRRRDAARRRGDPMGSSSRSRPAPVERKSGQGSKAQRYKAREEEDELERRFGKQQQQQSRHHKGSRKAIR